MKDFEDALLDVSINNLTIASNKHSNIDNKAIAIITISGFLISLLAGGSISNSCGVFDSSYIMAKVLFLCCILAFFITVWICTKAIKPRKNHEMSIHDLIKHLSNENPERQIQGTIGTMADDEKERLDICDKKATQLWNAVRALQVSILLMGFYAIAAFLGI
ncbi:hypothetical protein MSHOH_1483 [Methanosarcina horonobensis HB-1 = JCM 15518]|uniref:Pycsar effector protein domain-containing protein n=1 Tax=Methanosarcina horonobensis HB-1 = JCM 15518 TaxID=1434110 RepID=A0A0E3SAY2_9EURY|nr:hypothetical protein [Methanosarcina horonobensis]AKB77966.1 hypothetical protein MSHOH_1483 [Methanosarcina horonobensis HB-1 = JCM 15518]